MKVEITDYESEVMFEGNSVYRGRCPKCGDSIAVCDGFVPNRDYYQKCSCGLTWSVNVSIKFEGESDEE